jgi:hypothetical protein
MERKLFQQMVDDLGLGKGTLLGGIGEEKMIEPELYKRLGIEPIYERYDEQLTGLKKQKAELEAEQARLRTMSKYKKEKIKGKGGDPEARLTRVGNRLDVLNTTIGRLEAQPGTITGFRTLSPGEGTGIASLTQMMQGRLGKALGGELPDDPRLLRQLEDQEATLQERMRRQLGPGWETSSAGIEAMRQWEAYKRETLASAQEAQIRNYTSMLPTMAGVTQAEMQNLVFPSRQTMGAGQAIQQAGLNYMDPLQLLQRERTAEIGAAYSTGPSTAEAAGASFLNTMSYPISLYAGGMAEQAAGQSNGLPPVYYQSGPLAGKEVLY